MGLSRAEVWETGTLSSATKARGGDWGEAQEDETRVLESREAAPQHIL